MSSISKAPSTNDISTESLEESGWTKYFEEFFNNQNDNQNCSISLSAVAGSSNSLVSDAASLAAKKLADNEKPEEFPLKKNVKRSSLKNRKNIITALADEALEDTASSPLSSSKVHFSSPFFFFLHYYYILITPLL